MTDTSNTRIKEVPGLPGIYSEAIADTITILYNPAEPLKTNIGFAYKDYLRTADGAAVSFADGKYDLIYVPFTDLLAEELGVPALELMEAIRVAADKVHNKHRKPLVTPEVE